MEIIRLKPVFKQMIWGGNKLRDEFSYDVDAENIGECWGISAHPNGDCTVSGGVYDGMQLSQLYAEHRELFGNIDSYVFPLLTKIIDADTDLSIQVHPDDEYAGKYENGSLGKTECWYVLDAEPGTTIVIGHNAKNHQEVADMIHDKRWKEFIREIPVKKGDFFQINPGTLHAIKGGTLILETQQNSDITYRVYDYDRLTDGKPRPLHVKKSIDVITAPYHEMCEEERAQISKGLQRLVSCNYYTVWKMDVDGYSEFAQDGKFFLASVTDGSGSINGEKLNKGEHFIIPYGYGAIKFEGEMELIISCP